MRPTLVFCGPTISANEVKVRLGAVCLPPAVQGSIVSAVLHFDPSVIVLIDGGFQTEPAVKHKEILWAMSRGVAVVGAASMGALRAAELYPHMIGVGFIYRWYRRFALAADDAVAVQHGPEELNFVSLNDALIDLRLTFRLAQRQNKIPRELAQKLEISAKALNFRERALSRVISDALPNATNSELNDTNAILAASYVRQKHVDALKALDLVRTGSFKTPKIPGEFVMTRAFANDLLDSGIDIKELRKVATGKAFT